MKLAVMTHRHTRFTPDELDRMPVASARWVVEHLPSNIRRIVELEESGDDDTAWLLSRAVASIVGRIRRGEAP